MKPRKDSRSPHSRARRLVAAAALCAAGLLLAPRPASAQLDPLLFLQRNQPNVVIAVDVSRSHADGPGRQLLRSVQLPEDRRGVGRTAWRQSAATATSRLPPHLPELPGHPLSRPMATSTPPANRDRRRPAPAVHRVLDTDALSVARTGLLAAFKRTPAWRVSASSRCARATLASTPCRTTAPCGCRQAGNRVPTESGSSHGALGGHAVDRLRRQRLDWHGGKRRRRHRSRRSQRVRRHDPQPDTGPGRARCSRQAGTSAPSWTRLWQA